MSETQIRRAALGDGGGCAEVWREAGQYFAELNPDLGQVPDCSNLADQFDGLCAAASESAEQLFLIAVAGDTVRGLLLARLLEVVDNAALQLDRDLGRRRAQIDALVVREEHRRHGIGTSLMEAAQDWARDSGAEVLLLETEANNPLSVPFYRDRQGFTARLVKFRKELG